MRRLFKMRDRAAKHLKVCAVASVLIITISTGTSWAFTTYDGYDDVPTLKVKSVALEPRLQYQPSFKPSSAVTDSCLPLLKSIQKTPSQSVTDRNQRTAGKVAAPVAVGLIFGVRYALTPPGSAPAYKAKSSENNANGNFDVWHRDAKSVSEDSRSALAVSAYRTCQKKQALSALNDFRWSR